MGDKDSAAAALPETRSLPAIIAALDVVIPEVQFQAYRLREHIVPRTEEEKRHFDKMRESYLAAEETLKTLRRYHQKRLNRLAERGTLEMQSFDQADAIDPTGRASAVVDDSESPV